MSIGGAAGPLENEKSDNTKKKITFWGRVIGLSLIAAALLGVPLKNRIDVQRSIHSYNSRVLHEMNQDGFYLFKCSSSEYELARDYDGKRIALSYYPNIIREPNTVVKLKPVDGASSFEFHYYERGKGEQWFVMLHKRNNGGDIKLKEYFYGNNNRYEAASPFSIGHTDTIDLFELTEKVEMLCNSQEMTNWQKKTNVDLSGGI